MPDGVIQRSQAVLIANRKALQTHPDVLEMARRLLEYIEAHLRGKDNLLVIANMRGENPAVITEKIFKQTDFGGLQGTNDQPDRYAMDHRIGIPCPSLCVEISCRKPSLNCG